MMIKNKTAHLISRPVSMTVLAVLTTVLAACSSTPSAAINPVNTSPQHTTSPSTSQPAPNTSYQSAENKQRLIVEHSKQIQSYLAKGQFDKLISFVHPTKGVRFSMYAYVQPGVDKVFSREQFETYLKQSRIKFTWGHKDGKGDLYVTPLPDYLSTWVKAEDFNNISPTYNQFQGSGNSLNNLQEAYPNAQFVEFYNPGMNPEYQGMDWRALRLVFEEYQGQYYLVAIINDQWTV